MIACAITGCGNTKGSGDKEPVLEGQTTTEIEEADETIERLSAEEETSSQYQYVEKVMIEDYYGDRTEQEIYAPMGSQYDSGFLFYYDHGLIFSANTYSSELSASEMYEIWEDVTREQAQEWGNDLEYSEVQIGETVKAGDDRYRIISANRQDYEGIPYQVKKVFYMNIREANKCVEWTLELSEFQQDDDTELIVGEIAECYGIDLDSLSVAGEWGRLDAQRQVAAQDVYEPAEGSIVLEKVDGYQYMGKAVAAFDGGAIQCPVMVPMGRMTDVGEWSVSSSMHGVAVRFDCYKTNTQNHFAILEDNADVDCRIAEEAGAKNIKKSALMTMKDYDTAAYIIVAYEEPDETGADYDVVSKVCGMAKVKDSYLVSCNITLRSSEYDTATDTLLRELEIAYGIDLSDYYYEKKEVDDKDAIHQDTLATLLKNSGLINSWDSTIPETILWFNASYAALTYSNSWDWHLIGGIEPSEDNIAIAEMLLQSNWSVKDRESALKTVDRLKTEGHRERCRECMEQLEDWGLMEADSKDFLDKLLEKDTDVNPGRYVVAYMMLQNDIAPEYIAAWDLCRVNQLYASYYLCGYMTYEEAMDASLENSLMLQGMYSSWEEMMDAYMIGYQFWQGDLAITEDSPTLKRYHFYEMLCEMPDGPYSLDWDMKLKKSW